MPGAGRTTMPSTLGGAPPRLSRGGAGWAAPSRHGKKVPPACGAGRAGLALIGRKAHRRSMTRALG
eukprot:scaffold23797_cov118-Isochrysis_galbana.AAC.2